MKRQKIFSIDAISSIKNAFEADGGDLLYLKPDPFAYGFPELESPDIDFAEGLADRVNPKSNAETAIALFEAFPHLDPLQAASSGLWTHLTHIELWTYMQERFSLNGKDRSELRETIQKRWFMGEPSQASLIHHPLAGLWWGAYLTRDPERGPDGQYDLTRILYRNLDVPTRTLGTYELGRLPAAVKGTLGYVFDHPDEFENQFEKKMREIMKMLNSIGGVLQLGVLDEEFFRHQIEVNKDLWIHAKKTQKPKQNDSDLTQDLES